MHASRCVSRLRCGVSSSTGAKMNARQQRRLSAGALQGSPQLALCGTWLGVSVAALRSPASTAEMSSRRRSSTATHKMRFKESTRICLVWSTPQSNYLTPLFCDSVLSPCSLILNLRSDVSLLAQYEAKCHAFLRHRLCQIT